MPTNDEIKEKIYEDTLNELAKTLLSYKDDNIPAITDIETAVKLAIDKTDAEASAGYKEEQKITAKDKKYHAAELPRGYADGTNGIVIVGEQLVKATNLLIETTRGKSNWQGITGADKRRIKDAQTIVELAKSLLALTKTRNIDD